MSQAKSPPDDSTGRHPAGLPHVFIDRSTATGAGSATATDTGAGSDTDTSSDAEELTDVQVGIYGGIARKR